jgi:hypothetical protein
MKNNFNINIVMAYIWLTVAILSMGLGIHKTVVAGFKNSYMFFIVFVLAFTMYFLRKNLKPPNHN